VVTNHKSLHKTQALQGGLLFMELFLLSRNNLALQELYPFAGPVGDCAIMLAVQRKTVNIPKQTTNNSENINQNEH
jgi:hypothetical protein